MDIYIIIAIDFLKAPDGSYFFFPYNQSTPDAGLCRFASSYFTKAAPKAFENIHNYEDLYEGKV